jgi:site-specific DNA recombinase
MTQAAIYARLSQVRDEEDAEGINRQTADCEAFCAQRDWQVVEIVADSDASAFSGKERPGFERLKAMAAAEEIDRIVVWKFDRLVRRPQEFEALWAECEAREVHIASVADGIDTSIPMIGELLPRMITMIANMESKNISVRQKRKHLDLAQAGRHHGGGTRPFGLTADWSAIEPEEAAHLRDAAERLLAG